MFGRERVAASEVIRPAAIVPEDVARSILVDLAVRDVASGTPPGIVCVIMFPAAS